MPYDVAALEATIRDPRECVFGGCDLPWLMLTERLQTKRERARHDNEARATKVQPAGLTKLA
jgi:hypothetical protein